jgi:hypothetical protein
MQRLPDQNRRPPTSPEFEAEMVDLQSTFMLCSTSMLNPSLLAFAHPAVIVDRCGESGS